MAKRSRRLQESDDEADDDYNEQPQTAQRRAQKQRKMSKASSSSQANDEGELYGDREGDVTNLDESIHYKDQFSRSGINKMSKAFVRALLGLEFKYQIITKTMIKNVYDAESESMVLTKWKDVQAQLSSEFGKILGMELVTLESKKKSDDDLTSGQPQKNKSKKKKHTSGNDTDYILTSSIPEHLREVMFKMMQSEPAVRQGQYTDILDEIRSHGNTFNILKPSSEIVEHGIKMLVISILALSEGMMIKEQLFTVLSKRFGIKVADTHKIEELGNMTMSEFLDQLAKQEYINQSVVKTSENDRSGRLQKTSNTNHNLVQISIGRRLKAELPRDAFLSMLQEIYGGDWNDETLKSALFTLNNIYGGQSNGQAQPVQ